MSKQFKIGQRVTLTEPLVKVLNAHEALVRALRAVSFAFCAIVDELDAPAQLAALKSVNACKVLARAREALALAEGKQ